MEGGQMSNMSESIKYPGITSPISLQGPKPLDEDLSRKLEEAMTPHGVFETEEELAKRYALFVIFVHLGFLQIVLGIFNFKSCY